MRWWSLIPGLAFGLVAVACGSSAAVGPPADVESGLLFDVAQGVATDTPSPLPSATATATATPSSKIAPLQPEPWAPAPLLLRNAPVPPVNAAAVLVMDEASGSVKKSVQ